MARLLLVRSHASRPHVLSSPFWSSAWTDRLLIDQGNSDDAETTIAAEWEHDRRGQDELTRELLMDSIFVRCWGLHWDLMLYQLPRSVLHHRLYHRLPCGPYSTS